MKTSTLLAATFVLIPAGCAAKLAGSGLQLNELKTRDQVHQKLGEPTTSDINSGDRSACETFNYHGKVADRWSEILCSKSRTADYILEPLHFVLIAGSTVYHSVTGREIRILYDNGNVAKVKAEGISFTND